MSKDKTKPRVKVPKSAAVGEVVTIKTLINHVMESGQRKNKETGEKIPRMVVNSFVATFNGKEVVTFNPQGGVSQNPFFQFTLKVPEAGDIKFTWTDDSGAVFETTKSIAIG